MASFALCLLWRHSDLVELVMCGHSLGAGVAGVLGLVRLPAPCGRTW